MDRWMLAWLGSVCAVGALAAPAAADSIQIHRPLQATLLRLDGDRHVTLSSQELGGTGSVLRIQGRLTEAEARQVRGLLEEYGSAQLRSPDASARLRTATSIRLNVSGQGAQRRDRWHDWGVTGEIEDVFWPIVDRLERSRIPGARFQLQGRVGQYAEGRTAHTYIASDGRVYLVANPEALGSGSAEVRVEVERVERVQAFTYRVRVTEVVDTRPVPRTQAQFRNVYGQTGWVQTLWDNGSSAERYDIVLVAEGFGPRDAQLFKDTTDAIAAQMQSTAPFGQYRALINLHRIFVASPSSDIYNEDLTVFGTHAEREDWSIIEGNTGRVEQAVLDALPGDQEADAIVVVCNNRTGRGVCRGTVSYITLRNAPTVAIHELGHSMAKLDDEYTEHEMNWLESTRQYVQVNWLYPAPNVAYLGDPAARAWSQWGEGDREDIPWAEWIDDATTIPCASGSGDLGAFQGARHYSVDLFRPRENCLMKSNVVPFCEPCREAMVHSIYARCDVADFSYRRLDEGAMVLQVTDIVPDATQRVEWTWSGPGEAPPELLEYANLPRLLLPAGDYPAGATVTATLRDATSWVIQDTETLRWRGRFDVGTPREGEDLGQPESEGIIRTLGRRLGF